MKRVLRQWRWIILGVLLFAVGWGLHSQLTNRPRWTAALDLSCDWFECHWSADGRTMWTLPGDRDIHFTRRGPIQLWDAATGRERARFAKDDLKFLFADASRDARLFAGLIWDPVKRIHLLRLIDFVSGNEKLVSFEEFVNCGDLFFSPAGELLFLRTRPESQPDTVELPPAKVLDPFTGEILAHVNMGRNIAFIGEGRYLLHPTRDKSGEFVQLWDLSRRTRAWSLPDKGFQMRVGQRDFDVRCGQWERCRQVAVYSFPGGEAAIAVSEDGQKMVTRKNESGLHALWDLREPSNPVEVCDLQLGKGLLGEMSVEGTWLATTSREEEKWVTRLWDLSRGKSQHEFHHGLSRVAMFSPDSKTFVFHSLERETGKDAEELLRAMDVETGRILWERPVVTSRFFWPKGVKSRDPFDPWISPDSRFVIAQGLEKSVEIVDLRTGELVLQNSSPWQQPEKPTLSQDGRYLLLHTAISAPRGRPEQHTQEFERALKALELRPEKKHSLDPSLVGWKNCLVNGFRRHRRLLNGAVAWCGLSI